MPILTALYSFDELGLDGLPFAQERLELNHLRLDLAFLISLKNKTQYIKRLNRLGESSMKNQKITATKCD